MAKRKSSRPSRLLCLIALAGPVSAASAPPAPTVLTLSDFESLTATAPQQCIFAYNNPIRGCTPNDFAVGKTCSEGCKEGLQAIQFNVRSLCNKVDTSHNNLLAQIQKSNIVNTLCKPAPAPPPKPSAKANPPKTTSKPAPTSTVDTDSTSSTTPATESTASTTASPSSSARDELSTSSSQTTDASTSTEPSPKQTPHSGSGGGSPFDVVSSGTIAKAHSASAVAAIALALAGWCMI